ncbi:hypothetical protein RhiirA4_488337 [Rhizophagus irregularis]|uniref:UBC core domain-containing protein n=1 Tax=Rhizophagus irregularis TaxID=588596 RepID=A0A2I1HTS5_9GLOM|nr:hypothetical protein RhiirA4_488337 [Rhizophagus irregularis]
MSQGYFIIYLDICLPSDFHPNIIDSESIDVDFLRDQYSPEITISRVLSGIYQLLRYPNLTDRNHYEATVREWTRKYSSETLIRFFLY